MKKTRTCKVPEDAAREGITVRVIVEGVAYIDILDQLLEDVTPVLKVPPSLPPSPRLVTCDL